MLERFVAVVGDAALPFLLYAALAVILTPRVVDGWPRASRQRLAAAALGTLGAIVFAALRATAVISSRTAVSIPTLAACVAVDVVLVAVLARLVAAGRVQRDPGPVTQAVACAAIALTFFRAVPEPILQLTAFIEPGEATFSSEMVLRVLGFVGGWAAVALLAAVYYRAARRAPVALTGLSLLVFVTAVLGVHVVELVSVLHSTHRVQLHGPLFRAVIWGSNNEQGLILLGAAAIWLVPMLVAGARATGRVPRQDNAARTRALRAGRRRSRRWVLASAVGFGALVTTRTVAVAKVNEVPTLSEPEPYQVTDSHAQIASTVLADGHLHRFSYDAAGTQVRFIAILKNGGSYGVGLDACESCGPSGYYEADGKVVCKRCDVAINPATIGFKGGCNPIPLEFTVQDGTLMIPTSALDDAAEVFA